MKTVILSIGQPVLERPHTDLEILRTLKEKITEEQFKLETIAELTVIMENSF